jgi:hypothetical protein
MVGFVRSVRSDTMFSSEILDLGVRDLECLPKGAFCFVLVKSVSDM